MIEIINPATEEKITTISPDTVSTLTEKMNLLRAHRPRWTDIPLTERVHIMHRFAAGLKAKINHLAPLLSQEMGKPLQQSRNEVNGASGRVSWLAHNAEKYLAPETMTEEPNLVEKIIYEPLGVICNISAWNFPYNVGVNVFVPALLAGNAVLYKPSEYTILTGEAIRATLLEAGIPAEIFQIAYGDGSVGEKLLDLPLDGYFFTGSYKTGQYIYERVAPKMVPCQLELGGKDPVYITDDITDLRAAAAGVADGAFYNNGQSCCAVERIYVHEKVYDSFVAEFVKEVTSWKIGKPDLEGVYITVVSRKSQVDFLDDQVRDAVSKGATVLTGGARIEAMPYGYQPTVLINVDHSMSIMTEESFGPVIGIQKVRSDDEAIRLMNDTAYGLTAAVYSATLERAEPILRRMESGTVYWNCCDRVSAPVPWSGRKHSGFGSTLSHIGLRAFTRPKAYQLRSS
jgi:acyl-CoA reductase-like NAD-dependent aldehyde dehydrogenase